MCKLLFSINFFKLHATNSSWQNYNIVCDVYNINTYVCQLQCDKLEEC